MLSLVRRPHIFIPAWYPVGIYQALTGLPDLAHTTVTLTQDGITDSQLTGAAAVIWMAAWEQHGLRILPGDVPDALQAGWHFLTRHGLLVAWPYLTTPWDLWARGLAAVPVGEAPPDLPAPAADLLNSLRTDAWLVHYPPPSVAPDDRGRWIRAALTPLLGRAVALVRPSESAS